MLSMAAAAILLAGCNTEPAGTDEASGVPARTADTLTAVKGDAADTAANAQVLPAKKDSTIQQVEELTLHALGNTPEKMRFDRDTLEAKAGAFVKLQLINEAQDMSMVHNIVITAPDKYKQVAIAGAQAGASGNYVPNSQAVVAASSIALPGQTVTLEFTAPATPGAYDFVCTYANHWQRTHGKFIVK